MKVVFVRPERCVGCMQCMTACAVEHSRSKSLAGAIGEDVLSMPRIHIGAGLDGEGFPNRCRHCDPAPCLGACPTAAIARDPVTATVTVDAGRCIRCASCAMACPFGVIRFQPDVVQNPVKPIALKCDNCRERQSEGRTPACVEMCKAGALLFAELNDVLSDKTGEVARRTTLGLRDPEAAEGSPMDLLLSLKARAAAL